MNQKKHRNKNNTEFIMVVAILISSSKFLLLFCVTLATGRCFWSMNESKWARHVVRLHTIIHSIAGEEMYSVFSRDCQFGLTPDNNAKQE